MPVSLSKRRRSSGSSGIGNDITHLAISLLEKRLKDADTPSAFCKGAEQGRSRRWTARGALRKSARLVNNAKFVIQVCKGLVRHAKARRLLMFYSVLVALVMLFAGSTLLWPLLRDHPLVFLGWWAVCAWLTLLAILLALYDLVRVRAEARQLERELARQYLEKRSDDANPR